MDYKANYYLSEEEIEWAKQETIHFDKPYPRDLHQEQRAFRKNLARIKLDRVN